MQISIQNTIMQKGKPAQAIYCDKTFIAPCNAHVVDKLAESNCIIDYSDSLQISLDEFLEYKVGFDKSGAILTPSYGRISRYGIINTVTSMPQFTITAKDAVECFGILQVIAGYDNRDSYSLLDSDFKVTQSNTTPKVADFTQVLNADKHLQALFNAASDTHGILASAEYAANTQRFDGISFGHRAENAKTLKQVYVESRNETFTQTAKQHILLGNLVLAEKRALYDKALYVRGIAKQAMDTILQKNEVLTVTHPTQNHFALAAIAGCPTLLVNNTLYITKHLNEDALYSCITVACR